MSQQNDQGAEVDQPEWLKNFTPTPGHGRGNPNWKKGGPSPNPNGRTAKFGVSRTAIANQILDNATEVVEVMIAKALEGDSGAASLLLSRVIAPLKAEGGRVQFEFDASLSISEQVEQVLSAIAAGAVSPEVGKSIIESLGALSQARATEELEQRIITLEAKAV